MDGWLSAYAGDEFLGSRRQDSACDTSDRAAWAQHDPGGPPVARGRGWTTLATKLGDGLVLIPW